MYSGPKTESLFFLSLYLFEKHLFLGKLRLECQLSLLVKKACCQCLASLVNAILGVWLLFSLDSSSNTFNIKQLFVVVVQNFASLFFDVFSLKISVSISSLCLRQYFTLRANEPSNHLKSKMLNDKFWTQYKNLLFWFLAGTVAMFWPGPANEASTLPPSIQIPPATPIFSPTTIKHIVPTKPNQTS